MGVSNLIIPSSLASLELSTVEMGPDWAPGPQFSLLCILRDMEAPLRVSSSSRTQPGMLALLPGCPCRVLL